MESESTYSYRPEVEVLPLFRKRTNHPLRSTHEPAACYEPRAVV